MNNTDIRKYLKKGEQAVDVLEQLGYKYVSSVTQHPHWVAPVNPLSEIQQTLEKLIAEQAKKYREDELKGPNWESVKHLKGAKFSVKTQSIPKTNKLSDYNSLHFSGKLFEVEEVRYLRSPEFTGYVVLFQFNTDPFRAEVVWLPLSCCAFPK